MNSIKITSPLGAPFYDALKEKVNNYFLTKKRTGNLKLFIKTAIIILTAIGLYLLPFFAQLSYGTYLLTRALSGFNMSLVGFNIGHDAIHDSYCESKKWNKIIGYAFDVSGVSSFFWFVKHNILHHFFTNTEDDDDLFTNKTLRLAPFQKWYPVYFFQPIYAILLYCLEHLYWVFFADFKKYNKQAVGKREINNMSKTDKMIFLAGKIQFVIKSLIIPVIFFGFWKGILGFLIMEFTCGLVLSVVFQLAHVQRKSQFFISNKDRVIEEEWAVHQVKTTADFETWNPVLSWLLGGLNFQTVHHLFPRISHIHYPAIQKLVIKNCEEFKIPYNHYNFMFGAFVSHIYHLCVMAFNRKVLKVII